MEKILSVFILLMCGCIVFACSEKGVVTGGACSINELQEQAPVAKLSEFDKQLKSDYTILKLNHAIKSYRPKEPHKERKLLEH